MRKIKQLANWVTASRFFFAALLVCATPFSALFWAMYLCGGLSDIVDGPVARKWNQQSETGARLDSAADLAFSLAAGIAVIRGAVIPAAVLICAAGIALVRLIAYGIGYRKYRTFSALHTYLNKAAGALLFSVPLLYRLLGSGAACWGVCIISMLSALEELVITVTSKKLDRNRRGLISGNKGG